MELKPKEDRIEVSASGDLIDKIRNIQISFKREKIYD